jgi:hypothetical protein
MPPKANSAFVAAMEDVLAVYTRPLDPERPLVCVDETSKQLIAQTRTPIPMKPERPVRVDYEYERNVSIASQCLLGVDGLGNGCFLRKPFYSGGWPWSGSRFSSMRATCMAKGALSFLAANYLDLCSRLTRKR